MSKKAFHKFYWGFLFIMLNIPIMGFDILPDAIGYIFIYQGLSTLEDQADNFKQAKELALPMIFLSIFSIYDFESLIESRFALNGSVIFIFIGMVVLIMELLIIHHLFMGIKKMASKENMQEIENEAQKRWDNYKLLMIATLSSIFLAFAPPIALIFLLVVLVASIIIMIKIMKFMKRCGEKFI